MFKVFLLLVLFDSSSGELVRHAPLMPYISIQACEADRKKVVDAGAPQGMRVYARCIQPSDISVMRTNPSKYVNL